MRIPAAFAAITLVLCCDLAAQAPRDTATLNQWKPIETVTSKGPEGLENPDTLVLRNGRRISAELHNTRFLGFIPSRGGPPYLVLAGRGCGECDAIEAVYIQ